MKPYRVLIRFAVQPEVLVGTLFSSVQVLPIRAIFVLSFIR